MSEYDSTEDTLKHIEQVRDLLDQVVREIRSRAHRHDASKLEAPEKPVFDEYTPKLRDTTYGSEEYEKYREEMQVALDHHYANNRHHPEHFEDGIHGMHLIDLVEMLMDWKAATLRHDDGDIRRSIKQNQDRFGYGEEIKALLHNTIDWLEERVRQWGRTCAQQDCIENVDFHDEPPEWVPDHKRELWMEGYMEIVNHGRAGSAS